MTSDDEQAIRAVVANWLAATRAGDLDTVASLMADDVVFLTSGRPPFGKTEFIAASKAMVGAVIDGTSTIEELHKAGATAYLRSSLRLTITPPSGVSIQKSGSTLTILRKERDGRWRLARDANLMI